MNDLICFFNDTELSFRTGIEIDFSGYEEIYSGDYDYVLDVDNNSIIGVALNVNLISETSINFQISLASTLNTNKNILNWDGYHICFCKYVRSASSIYVDVRQVIGVRIHLNSFLKCYIMSIPVWDKDIIELISHLHQAREENYF